MQAGYYPDIPAPFGANMPSTPSTSRSSSPEPESPTDPQSIVDLLRSYTLPLEHAEQIADLLDASGVSDMDYMRILARISSTQGRLCERRDELIEVQMRLLREILLASLRVAEE